MSDEHDPAILLSTRDVKKVAPVSSMSIWRWVRDGKFPQPLKLGSRNFWRRDEIEAWLAERSAARPPAV